MDIMVRYRALTPLEISGCPDLGFSREAVEEYQVAAFFFFLNSFQVLKLEQLGWLAQIFYKTFTFHYALETWGYTTLG